jgi:hypothetical protein
MLPHPFAVRVTPERSAHLLYANPSAHQQIIEGRYSAASTARRAIGENDPLLGAGEGGKEAGCCLGLILREAPLSAIDGLGVTGVAGGPFGLHAAEIWLYAAIMARRRAVCPGKD